MQMPFFILKICKPPIRNGQMRTTFPIQSSYNINISFHPVHSTQAYTLNIPSFYFFAARRCEDLLALLAIEEGARTGPFAATASLLLLELDKATLMPPLLLLLLSSIIVTTPPVLQCHKNE